MRVSMIELTILVVLSVMLGFSLGILLSPTEDSPSVSNEFVSWDKYAGATRTEVCGPPPRCPVLIQDVTLTDPIKCIAYWADVCRDRGGWIDPRD